jgi:hypothetical protein
MTNNSKLAGQLAAKKELFGGHSRYAIAPIHTRFDAVQWFVWDAEQIDNQTGFASVIRQAQTKAEALVGL